MIPALSVKTDTNQGVDLESSSVDPLIGLRDACLCSICPCNGLASPGARSKNGGSKTSRVAAACIRLTIIEPFCISWEPETASMPVSNSNSSTQIGKMWSNSVLGMLKLGGGCLSGSGYK